ncbi:hypothetical protein GF327_05830 [Candidatus Woesearchaeota archaeon]|nr:hypothetical protein [Candidatus Woesearchaeota archaeon]
MSTKKGPNNKGLINNLYSYLIDARNQLDYDSKKMYILKKFSGREKQKRPCFIQVDPEIRDISNLITSVLNSDYDQIPEHWSQERIQLSEKEWKKHLEYIVTKKSDDRIQTDSIWGGLEGNGIYRFYSHNGAYETFLTAETAKLISNQKLEEILVFPAFKIKSPLRTATSWLSDAARRLQNYLAGEFNRAKNNDIDWGYVAAGSTRVGVGVAVGIFVAKEALEITAMIGGDLIATGKKLILNSREIAADFMKSPYAVNLVDTFESAGRSETTGEGFSAALKYRYLSNPYTYTLWGRELIQGVQDYFLPVSMVIGVASGAAASGLYCAAINGMRKGIKALENWF